MEPNWTFMLVTKIMFGENGLGELSQEVATTGLKRGLLVIDPALLQLGMHKTLCELFTSQGMELALCSDVEPNPRMSGIERAHACYVEGKCEFVIGFGGGSAIDTAKGVAVLATNPGPLSQYAGTDKYATPPCPLYAVPTTAGTGSEVSWSSVFFDDRARRKCSVRSSRHAPRVAALVPSLVASLPHKVIASGGIDALSHSVESLISVQATPTSQMFSLESIRGVARYLEAFYKNSRDMEAASGMLLASMYAGVAFLHARVGLAHAMSYPLEKLYGMPHGTACGCTLPAIMRFAAPRAVPLLACVSRIFLEAREPRNPLLQAGEQALADAAADIVENFIHAVGLPTGLKSWVQGSIPQADVETIVEGAIHTGNHRNSPVEPTAEDLRKLVLSLM